ncbi:tetratricopeptide repeat protein [Endozoicomonas arenosclerae]|uniref:tetratricopeptide repeat protein n=1 Tax=Endozoicomonas arenosclerae TaxID=1633495 RepID=UPI00078113D4|nr:tetratricopeptide repeat protein [Endozoicomonas arenosclerae]
MQLKIKKGPALFRPAQLMHFLTCSFALSISVPITASSIEAMMPAVWLRSGEALKHSKASDPPQQTQPRRQKQLISTFIDDACKKGENHPAELELLFGARMDEEHSHGITLNSTSMSSENQNWSVNLSPLSILSFLYDQTAFLFVSSDNGLPCFPSEPHVPAALMPQHLNLTDTQGKARQSLAGIENPDLSSSTTLPILANIDEQGYVTLFIVELTLGGYRIRKIRTSMHVTSKEAQELFDELNQYSNVLMATGKNACVAIDSKGRFYLKEISCDARYFIPDSGTTFDPADIDDLRFYQGRLLKRTRKIQKIPGILIDPETLESEFTSGYLPEPPDFEEPSPRQAPSKGSPRKPLCTVTHETIASLSEKQLRNMLQSDQRNGWDLRIDWRKKVAELERAGKYDEAIVFLKVLAENYPADSEPKKALVWALVKRNRVEEARQLVSDWMRNPDTSPDLIEKLRWMTNQGVRAIQQQPYKNFH